MPPSNRGRARASRSCGNCRAIKRRCDQRLPHCGQCTRLREACPGYRDEWDLVFRDQTKHTIKRSLERSARKAASTQPDRATPLAHSLSPNIIEIGVQYFFHNFVTSGRSTSHGCFNYVSTVGGLDTTHPTLVASMAAIGLGAMAKIHPQSGLAIRARAKYVEAVQGVNTALSSPTESLEDSTLMSVISLGLYDFTSSFESWTRHTQGAAALVVLRGKKQFSSVAAIPMFNQVRADVVVACIQTLKPFPTDLLELQEEANKHADTSSSIWRLGVLASRCATLLWGVRERKDVSQYKFLEEAISLQYELQSLFELLQTEEPYRVIRSSDTSSEIVYNGRFDLYKSPWAIRIWNNSRMTQTVVCEIMLHLLHACLNAENESAVQVRLEQRLHETLQILEELGDDTLATVPQALGLIALSHKDNIAVYPSQHARMSGGYMLTWCLYTAGKSPVTKVETRRWIIRQLQNIRKHMGITMTLKFIEEIEEMRELAN